VGVAQHFACLSLLGSALLLLLLLLLLRLT
jgi:hypothetical protein